MRGDRVVGRFRAACSSTAVRVPSSALDRFGDLAHDREDRALDRAHHRLVRRVGGAPESAHARSPAGTCVERRQVSATPRRICERITPELPRAPMSEPRLIAWHTSSIESAVGELGADRLEGERHVGAGVAVGDRVDVEPVQLLLMRTQRRHGSAARAWRRSAGARLVSVGIAVETSPAA